MDRIHGTPAEIPPAHQAKSQKVGLLRLAPSGAPLGWAEGRGEVWKMRTTSDTASDLPKVSDLPQVSGRGCVCPQSLPCPEFLILPPKPSCPSSCGDPRPSSTPYKPLPSYPELPTHFQKPNFTFSFFPALLMQLKQGTG